MILCLIGTAGLFGMLNAYFVAALQVLVYAGAIMVLFVFIIMLMDVEDEQSVKLGRSTYILASVVSVLMLFVVGYLFFQPELKTALPEIEETVSSFTSARYYGTLLYGKYLLPVLWTGLLLLIAMVSVIVISKDLSGKEEEPKQ